MTRALTKVSIVLPENIDETRKLTPVTAILPVKALIDAIPAPRLFATIPLPDDALSSLSIEDIKDIVDVTKPYFTKQLAKRFLPVPEILCSDEVMLDFDARDLSADALRVLSGLANSDCDLPNIKHPKLDTKLNDLSQHLKRDNRSESDRPVKRVLYSRPTLDVQLPSDNLDAPQSIDNLLNDLERLETPSLNDLAQIESVISRLVHSSEMRTVEGIEAELSKLTAICLLALTNFTNQTPLKEILCCTRCLIYLTLLSSFNTISEPTMMGICDSLSWASSLFLKTLESTTSPELECMVRTLWDLNTLFQSPNIKVPESGRIRLSSILIKLLSPYLSVKNSGYVTSSYADIQSTAATLLVNVIDSKQLSLEPATELFSLLWTSVSDPSFTSSVPFTHKFERYCKLSTGDTILPVTKLVVEILHSQYLINSTVTEKQMFAMKKNVTDYLQAFSQSMVSAMQQHSLFHSGSCLLGWLDAIFDDLLTLMKVPDYPAGIHIIQALLETFIETLNDTKHAFVASFIMDKFKKICVAIADTEIDHQKFIDFNDIQAVIDAYYSDCDEYGFLETPYTSHALKFAALLIIYDLCLEEENRDVFDTWAEKCCIYKPDPSNVKGNGKFATMMHQSLTMNVLSQSKILVTNSSKFTLDLQVRLLSAIGNLVPKFDYLLRDEDVRQFVFDAVVSEKAKLQCAALSVCSPLVQASNNDLESTTYSFISFIRYKMNISSLAVRKRMIQSLKAYFAKCHNSISNIFNIRTRIMSLLLEFTSDPDQQVRDFAFKSISTIILESSKTESDAVSVICESSLYASDFASAIGLLVPIFDTFKSVKSALPMVAGMLLAIICADTKVFTRKQQSACFILKVISDKFPTMLQFKGASALLLCIQTRSDINDKNMAELLSITTTILRCEPDCIPDSSRDVMACFITSALTRYSFQPLYEACKLLVLIYDDLNSLKKYRSIIISLLKQSKTYKPDNRSASRVLLLVATLLAAYKNSPACSTNDNWYCSAEKMFVHELKRIYADSRYSVEVKRAADRCFSVIFAGDPSKLMQVGYNEVITKRLSDEDDKSKALGINVLHNIVTWPSEDVTNGNENNHGSCLTAEILRTGFQDPHELRRATVHQMIQHNVPMIQNIAMSTLDVATCLDIMDIIEYYIGVGSGNPKDFVPTLIFYEAGKNQNLLCRAKRLRYTLEKYNSHLNMHEEYATSFREVAKYYSRNPERKWSLAPFNTIYATFSFLTKSRKYQLFEIICSAESLAAQDIPDLKARLELTRYLALSILSTTYVCMTDVERLVSKIPQALQMLLYIMDNLDEDNSEEVWVTMNQCWILSKVQRAMYEIYNLDGTHEKDTPVHSPSIIRKIEEISSKVAYFWEYVAELTEDEWEQVEAESGRGQSTGSARDSKEGSLYD
ncbi:hypothetical protein CANCADRAFT_31330 [Tortispora caseinolytica NRRL Y-17796]|uniref:Sister chromatid cohesion C-terminal domain-containing protein n=1 Tax=Tortispora caseinolytica NRRL Y-17796 TaxID=767744 RepID=A0A1E4TF54_9ASCO|nr:hypothetical protein CANCADRAFT_31330 [Tortispora caseinolytica NRRL Y-17796]